MSSAVKCHLGEILAIRPCFSCLCYASSNYFRRTWCRRRFTSCPSSVLRHLNWQDAYHQNKQSATLPCKLNQERPRRFLRIADSGLIHAWFAPRIFITILAWLLLIRILNVGWRTIESFGHSKTYHNNIWKLNPSLRHRWWLFTLLVRITTHVTSSFKNRKYHNTARWLVEQSPCSYSI